MQTYNSVLRNRGQLVRFVWRNINSKQPVPDLESILENMSKRGTYKANMGVSEQNLKKKQKLASLPAASAAATLAYVRVIQNGSNGFGKSLFLRTTSQAYLFNCPEG